MIFMLGLVRPLEEWEKARLVNIQDTVFSVTLFIYGSMEVFHTEVNSLNKTDFTTRLQINKCHSLYAQDIYFM